MARKRTKEEAKQRIDDLPSLVPLPRTLRRRALPLRAIDKAAKELAKVLVEIDPLDRLAEPSAAGAQNSSPEILAGGDRFPNIAEAQKRRREQMNREQAIRTVVNDPAINITEDLLPIINDPNIIMDEFGQLAQTLRMIELEEPKKKKKKVSKYQKELGKQLKLLKQKFPRTPVTKLMKKAHTATKKALK